MKKNNSGFSLLELLITIALVALLMSVAVVNFSFLSSWAVRSDVDTLYATCSYLQRCAMATNRSQDLTFDTSSHSYSFNGHTQKLAPSVVFGVVPGVKGPPASPTGLVSNPVTFANQSITFHPNGIISAGTVYLCDSNKRVQYALSSGVAQVSYIRTYGYSGAWKPRS